MESYALDVAFFFGGFIFGAAVCYIVLAQIYKHKRVKDELLKAKRAAVKSQRTLDRFLKNSLDMFGELDTAHRQYVQFLKETAQRIAPTESELHSFLSNEAAELPSFKGKEDEQTHSKKDSTSLDGTLDEIQPPNVLKSPEIPDSQIVQEILKKESEEASEEELEDDKTEEKIKV